MDDLIAFIPRELRGIVLGGVLGGMGGLIGHLVGTILEKVFNVKIIARVMAIIGVVLAIQLPRQYIRMQEKQETVQKIIIDLKKKKLFSSIFRYHPEAEKEMERKLTQIITEAPKDQIFLQAQVFASEIVTRYFEKHLIVAPDEETYNLIKQNLTTLVALKGNPTVCVNYFLGKPLPHRDSLPSDYLENEIRLKGEIIEKSVTAPSVTPKAEKIEDVGEILVIAYQKAGIALDDLDKLELVEQLPPAEGCAIATHFTQAMVEMGATQATFVLKNLMYANAK